MKASSAREKDEISRKLKSMQLEMETLRNLQDDTFIGTMMMLNFQKGIHGIKSERLGVLIKNCDSRLGFKTFGPEADCRQPWGNKCKIVHSVGFENGD